MLTNSLKGINLNNTFRNFLEFLKQKSWFFLPRFIFLIKWFQILLLKKKKNLLTNA